MTYINQPNNNTAKKISNISILETELEKKEQQIQNEIIADINTNIDEISDDNFKKIFETDFTVNRAAMYLDEILDINIDIPQIIRYIKNINKILKSYKKIFHEKLNNTSTTKLKLLLNLYNELLILNENDIKLFNKANALCIKYAYAPSEADRLQKILLTASIPDNQNNIALLENELNSLETNESRNQFIKERHKINRLKELGRMPKAQRNEEISLNNELNKLNNLNKQTSPKKPQFTYLGGSFNKTKKNKKYKNTKNDKRNTNINKSYKIRKLNQTRKI